MTVHDPVLNYLNTLSITGEYLTSNINDIPFLHYTITKYTQSTNVLNKYSEKLTNNNEINEIDENDEIYIPKYNGKLTNEMKIRFYIMQFRLELIMNEFTLANGTISRIKDLFSSLKIDEEIGPLSQVILLRSELLEIEACYNLSIIEKNKEKEKESKELNIIDKIADIKNTVNSYIDKSCKIILNSFNRSIALSISNSGNKSMRDSIDLYQIQKRKCEIDIDLVNLACSIELNLKDENKVSLNSNLAINESINALNDLLILRPLDIEIYLKLTYIYLNKGLFKISLFYISECLLNGGSNAYNIWSLRGEICYLQSNEKLNNSINDLKYWLLISISSFIYSIELNENYLRSWCGLHICLNKLFKLKEKNKNFKIDEIYYNIENIKNEKFKNFIQFKNNLSINDRENLNWIINKYPINNNIDKST